METSPAVVRFGIHSLKAKVTAFALIATLIPSLFLGLSSYFRNKQLLAQKIDQELQSVTVQTSRECDLWLKGRLFEARVFSTSYIVFESLHELVGQATSATSRSAAERHLRDYLTSVRGKFADYEELLVLTTDGRIVASSSAREAGAQAPKEWLAKGRADEGVVGQPEWDEKQRIGVVTVAQPIVDGEGTPHGALAARLNFRPLQAILTGHVSGGVRGMHVVSREGVVMTSSQPLPAQGKTSIAAQPLAQLLEGAGVSIRYTSFDQTSVIGAARLAPGLGLYVVAEEDVNRAYQQIHQLRNITIGLMVALLVIVGALAHLLGVGIARPLDRLIDGAARVAAGDLDVEVRGARSGEVGYLIQVFNTMVHRLRQDRDDLDAANRTLLERNKELHELSTLDSLTGLYNRSQLNEMLTGDLGAFARRNAPIALCMIDVDGFKLYNDRHGHLAGDEILRGLASIFRSSLRAYDYAARYGGDEFVLVLPNANEDAAASVAERIRFLVNADQAATGGDMVKVSLSIGVAMATAEDSTPEPLLHRADCALYSAKQRGRNCVVVFDSNTTKPADEFVVD